MIAQILFGAGNVESLLGECSFEITLLWIIVILVIEILLQKVAREYKEELGDSTSYASELPEPVFVPLKVSTEDLLAAYKDRPAPVFSLFTVQEQSSWSMESLPDLQNFGARFEPIRRDDEINLKPVPTNHLAFSKMMRFSRSEYELPIEDEIKTNFIHAATSPKNSESLPLEEDDDFPRKAPPRPRTPDFIELLRRNVPEAVESIFDEQPPEAIEILDRLDEEIFTKKPTPKQTVKLLFACNII